MCRSEYQKRRPQRSPRKVLPRPTQDGHAKPISFELNLQEVVNRFERIDEFTWSVFPEDSEHAEEPRAYATIGGIAKGNPVRFYFFSVAPQEAGPGMRVYQDGRFEPV